jgi:acyl-CoA thioester hydrolase
MKTDPRRLLLASYRWVQTMETRFADMDVNRHLNNVAFSRFFEETRIRFNGTLFANADANANANANANADANANASPRPRYLVAHVAIDYLGEGSYPEPVTMAYAVGSIGRTSFRSQKAMFQNDRCIALCDTVLVHRGDAGPAPLPDALRTRLEAFGLKG